MTLLKSLLLMGVGFAASSGWAQAPAPSPTPTPPAATPAPATNAVPGSFYYFCQSTSSYYPTVATCNEGWIAVPVSAPPPAPYYDHHYVWDPWDEPETQATRDMIHSRPNVISFELFGRALIYSLDYERAIADRWEIGLGLSSWQQSLHWGTYQSSVFVVPVFMNYYFSEKPARGFITGGADIISVSHTGPDNDNFEHGGVAGLVGVGFESRESNGFLWRMALDVVMGRSVDISPSVSVGFAF